MIRIQELIRRCAILAALPAALSPASGRAEEPTATASPREAAVADLTPLVDGPLHEAFLSPRRDQAPPLVTRSPLPPVVERPAVEAPNGEARWIGGYWDWDPSRDDFVWVTGTWRVPPPGRFWVNGFWKRGEDGWRRTPGFWSDRATDRIAYRKEGPPADRPLDDPGPPPKPNCFYIPGDYVPDGDRLAWRKGFWADAKLGWSWVPSSWTRQPEGWIFQEGYWDRPLEDRGILFAPASLAGEAREGGVLAYRPYTIVSPALYGQLYGAFGRSTSCYDGYPGVSYDGSGRFFAYADYGALPPYYGYLDYPAYGWRGNPYYASPLYYRSPYSAGLPVALANGLGVPYYGFGGSLLPIMMGYPIFGNLGLIGGGWGWGYPGWGMGGYGWGNSGWSGMALGTWPGFNWGTFGWSGPAIGAFPAFGFNIGFPNWTSGWNGFGWGGFGWGGFGLGSNWGGLGWGFPGGAWGGIPPIWAAQCPFPTSGRRDPTPPGLSGHRPGGGIDRTPGAGGDRLSSRGGMRQGPVDLSARGLGAMRGVDGVQPPPSTRPFASLIPPGEGRSAALAGAMRTGPGAERAATWTHAYNGVAPMAAPRREAARPTFTGEASGMGRMRQGSPNVPGGGLRANAGANPGGFTPRMRGDGANAGANPGGFTPRMRGDGASTSFAPQLHALPAPNPGVARLGSNPEGVGGMRGMRSSGVANAPGVAPGFGSGAVNAGGPAGFSAGAMRGAGSPNFGAPPAAGAINPGFGGMRGVNVGGGGVGDAGGGLGSGFSGGMRGPGGGFGGGMRGAGGFGGGVGTGGFGGTPSGGGFGGMRGGGGFGGGGMGGVGGAGFGGGMGGGGFGGGGGGMGAAGGVNVGGGGGGMGGAGGGGFGGHMR